MEGFQYAHLELFSVKGAPGAEGQGTGKRKNGARAWGVSDVLDEAERTPHSSHHVIADRPKPQVIPGASQDFAAVREAHAKASSIREKFNYTKKDGTKQVRRRKLRADSPTLYSSVYSLPVRSEDALKDTALRTECERVLRQAMDHERQRIGALGGSVELGVIHWDEEFAHIHILALDRSRGRVDHLHPGRKAKTEFHEANKSDEDRAGVRRAANKAYCDALRDWQDDIFEAVSKKAGLLRYGPKRFRLSREDYMTAKAIAAKRAEDEKLDEARTEKDARSARKAKDADLLLQGAKQKNASAEARIAAIDEGVAAIDSRVLDYNPKRDDKPEGLKFGPNASKEKKERREMSQRLAPAVDFLVGYARKVFTLRAKDKALKAARSRQAEKEDLFAETVRKMRDSLKREQDKTRARGDAVVKAFEALKKTAPAPILAMFFPSKARFTEQTFPDAWAVPVDAKPEWVEKQVAAMPNLTLWKVARENYDAELLSEEDPHLQSRYQAGLKAVHKEAADRGVDLTDGRHHPSKAKDPNKAMLHTDGNPASVRVKKRASQQVRTRSS